MFSHTWLKTANMFSQLFLLDDNREVYVILCNQMISAPLFFVQPPLWQETWWHNWAAAIKDNDCALLQQTYPTTQVGPHAACGSALGAEAGLIHRLTATNYTLPMLLHQTAA